MLLPLFRGIWQRVPSFHTHTSTVHVPRSIPTTSEQALFDRIIDLLKTEEIIRIGRTGKSQKGLDARKRTNEWNARINLTLGESVFPCFQMKGTVYGGAQVIAKQTEKERW